MATEHMQIKMQYRATRILLGPPGPDVDPRYISAANVLSRADQEVSELPELSFSSEEPVERWFGIEILKHTAQAIDFARAKDGLPLLLDHSTGRQIGIVEEIKLDKDDKLRGTPRFSKTDEAQGVKQDVLDGIRKWTSVGYRIMEFIVTKGKGTASDIYTATKWQPMEVSLVPVPADTTVGAGRAEGDRTYQVVVRTTPDMQGNSMEDQPMVTDTNPAAPVTTAVDIKAAADAEGTRVSAIYELCNQYGCEAKAREWVDAGHGPDQVAREILARRADGQLPQPAHDPVIKLTDKEAREYSLQRAILSAHENSDGLPGGFEREVHDEMIRLRPAHVKDNGGFYFPTKMRADRVAEQRALASDASGAGSELVVEQAGEFIDLLRNVAAVTRLGARTLTGLTAPVTFPRQKAGGTAVWTAQVPGSDMADSDLTLGTLTLAPKSLQSSTSYSRQLLQSVSMSVEQMVRQDMATAHALAIDLAALHGKGGDGEPTGIWIAQDVNAKAFGGAPSYGLMIDLATEVAADNALLGMLAFLTSPEMAGKLMQTEVAATTGQFIWKGRHDEGVVAGYRAISSNQVSKVLGAGTEHGITFGNWQDLIIGNWGGVEVVVDPYSKKKQALIEVTTFEMADILLRHGESFAKGTGATL